MIWTLRRSGDVYPCKCWGRAKCHPVKSPWSQVKDSWRTGAGKGWKEKWREKDGRKSLGSAVERDQTTHGKGFVMQRAGTGLCSPVSARSHRASWSCPPSPREHPVAKGCWMATELSGLCLRGDSGHKDKQVEENEKFSVLWGAVKKEGQK